MHDPTTELSNRPRSIGLFARVAARIIAEANEAGDHERVVATHAALGRVVLRRVGA